jgi:hypothetical protein
MRKRDVMINLGSRPIPVREVVSVTVNWEHVPPQFRPESINCNTRAKT